MVEKRLEKKAEQLLQVKEIKALYDRLIELNKEKDLTPLFLLRVIMFDFAEGPEVRELIKEYEAFEESLPDPKINQKKYDMQKREDIDEFIERVRGYQRRVDTLNELTEKALDIGLQLHKEGRPIIAWPKKDESLEPDLLSEHISIANSQLYYNFRRKFSAGSFTGEDWPEADISGSKVKGKALLRPDNISPVAKEEVLLELQKAMRDKVMDLAKRGDLAADVFDAITAKWLKGAKHHEATITITADDILEARGLLKKAGGSGRRGGYEEEQRREIQQQIDILSYIWITVSEMQIVEIDKKGKRKLKPWRGESRALVVSSREGQPRLDGSLDTFRWRVRPGDVFSKFLFGPGRQTALLSQKALNYDPYRQKWAKRLTRYLAWIWRISSGRTQEGILVNTLLEAVGLSLDATRATRTRQRLEDALDLLQKDEVISAWHYESEIKEGRGWWKKWHETKVIILAPEIILAHYKQIKGR